VNRETVVDVRNLTVRFGNFTAVDSVTFSVRRGEIFGFLGANGAGKTTTIRALCGLIIPTEGDVRISGISPLENPKELKRKIGYMSQKITLYPDMTVDENMAFAAALRKMPYEKYQNRKKELFDFTGISGTGSTLVGHLSGGVKQQIAFCVAVLADPDIIFLDEPTAGVSPLARAEFWHLIKKMVAGGKTIFITTHYMAEVENCDRIALMQEGKIKALGSPPELKNKFFQKPIYEIETEYPDKLKQIIEKQDCASIVPHGGKYHIFAKKEKECAKAMSALGNLITYKRISPSLEDVFIKAMEKNDD